MSTEAPDFVLSKPLEGERGTSSTIIYPSGEEQEALFVDLGGTMMEQPMLVDETGVRIRGFEQLPGSVRDRIKKLMEKAGKNVRTERREGIVTVIFPHSITDASGEKIRCAALLGKITHFRPPKKTKGSQKRAHYLAGRFTEPIDFTEVQNRASALADTIERNRDRIVRILTRYETHDVAEDEITRSLDLLRNLEENRIYFDTKVRRVAAFLPSNQPLYALTCFGVVPGFMAKEAHVKAPEVMKSFFPDLVEVLNLRAHTPNVNTATKPREEFVADMGSVARNAETGSEEPTTDVVIFTGTSEKAEEMRKRFRREVLFIVNGAGHNPLVVSSDADVDKAVEAAMAVQLYNQGQDCAAPNAILVHRNVHEEFLKLLRKKLKDVRVGPYSDPAVRVGPISRPDDLPRIEKLLVSNSQWLDPSTRGTTHADLPIVEPTIINKPLKEGGNFEEQFAPIFFVQMYEDDAALAQYFEDKRYEPHAMYVTVYGTSGYVERLKQRRTADGRLLHKEDSILRNTHLHAEGQERGTEEYGGSGKCASSVSFGDRTVGMATLPQREIGLLGKASRECLEVSVDEMRSSRIFQLKTDGKPEAVAGSFVYRIPNDITIKGRNDKYTKGLHPITRERVARLRSVIEQGALGAEDVLKCMYEIVEDTSDTESVRDAKRKTFRNVLFHLLVGKIMGKGKEQYLARILSFCRREKLLTLLDMQEAEEP